MIATTHLGTSALILATLGAAGVLLMTYVWIRLCWKRWQQRRRTPGEYPFAFLQAGFDFCVDGRPRARLIWAGPPADLNTLFTPYDVSILAGGEADVEGLLYHSRERHPNNAQISYRSLDPTVGEFCDSQVLIGYLGGNRIELKIYFHDPATHIA